MRLASRSDGRGWSLVQIWADSDRVGAVAAGPRESIHEDGVVMGPRRLHAIVVIPRESTRVAIVYVPRRSSDLTSAYALLVEPTEKYVNQKTHPQKHFVPGTWVLTQRQM